MRNKRSTASYYSEKLNSGVKVRDAVVVASTPEIKDCKESGCNFARRLKLGTVYPGGQESGNPGMQDSISQRAYLIVEGNHGVQEPGIAGNQRSANPGILTVPARCP